MPTRKPYLQHLTGSNDLLTTYEETRAGLVTLDPGEERSPTPSAEHLIC